MIRTYLNLKNMARDTIKAASETENPIISNVLVYSAILSLHM